jgi:hypothetical protein
MSNRRRNKVNPDDRTGATAAGRARPVYKWSALLEGIEAHANDRGWPAALGDDYVGRLRACIASVLAEDQVRLRAKASQKQEMALRAEGNALLEQAVAALGAWLGPYSEAMGDYGVKPKRRRG